MCKLIRSKSGVLNLVLTTEYVNEILERSTVTVEEQDNRPRLMIMETR